MSKHEDPPSPGSTGEGWGGGGFPQAHCDVQACPDFLPTNLSGSGFSLTPSKVRLKSDPQKT